jgi:hypothetical protein
LAGAEALDRTTINAWEDEAFLQAVKATAAALAEILFAVEGH